MIYGCWTALWRRYHSDDDDDDDDGTNGNSNYAKTAGAFLDSMVMCEIAKHQTEGSSMPILFKFIFL